MKPQIQHLDGTHLTAADRRNIIDILEYMRTKLTDGIGIDDLVRLKRKGSSKSYTIRPVVSGGSLYSVEIQERYRNDYGQPRARTSHHTVRTSGMKPLPHVKPDPEKELRRMWTDEGIDPARQEEILRQVRETPVPKFAPKQLEFSL